MKCLRCGHCCIHYSVVIVKDPEKGVREDNMFFHSGQEGPCPHLRGPGPGEYSCAIHDYEWYVETPCFSHGQFEREDSPCRLGKHILDKATKPTTLSAENSKPSIS